MSEPVAAFDYMDTELSVSMGHALDISFSTGSGPILTLTADRRVIWEGEQTEAALAFWRVVEQLWPAFIVQTARK